MELLGVGVPFPLGDGGGFDLILPLYMGLTLLVLRAVGRFRVSLLTGIVAFFGGTVWAWAAASFGVVPAASAAVLLTLAWGGLVRRVRRPA